MLDQLAYIRAAQTGRASSWDETGRNSDAWWIEPGESAVLADIKGPGRITHLWLTQANHYRECLLKLTWDDAGFPSVVCPLGDFFGLGHGLVNSYQSLLFSASTRNNHVFNAGCALNSYVQMPFRQRAVVELVNESSERHRQYFYDLAYEARGRSVTTIEGMEKADRTLHPIQQCFIDEFAFQCGFCTPGMILSAKALLDDVPDPSDEEIIHHMDGNLCRCTGYVPIVKAIRKAAAVMRQEAGK